MTIVAKAAPGNVAEAALRETAASAGAAARSLNYAETGGGPPATTSSAPLPVFSIPIGSLAAEQGDLLGAAVQTGWRVLTTHGSARQLVDLDMEGSPRMVRRGNAAAMVIRAGSLAEASVTGTTPFEPRVLDFGRLGMSALWLHDSSGDDRFFTLEDEPREIDAAELLGRAAGRASRRMDRTRADLLAEPDADIGG